MKLLTMSVKRYTINRLLGTGLINIYCFLLKLRVAPDDIAHVLIIPFTKITLLRKPNLWMNLDDNIVFLCFVRYTIFKARVFFYVCQSLRIYQIYVYINSKNVRSKLAGCHMYFLILILFIRFFISFTYDIIIYSLLGCGPYCYGWLKQCLLNSQFIKIIKSL